MRDQEYDRFGPWALEISDLDPPPPLFLPHLPAGEKPLLSVKIPRQIERRNARPGMNLYDHMIILLEDKLRILRRAGEGVRSQACTYRDIQCIAYGEDLLAGRLRFMLRNETLELPFSTVSSDLMGRVMNLVRERYADDTRILTIGEDRDMSKHVHSFYYEGVLKQIHAKRPDMRVLASQRETPVGKYESSRIRSAFFGLLGKRLLESLHLSDGRELVMMDQGRPFRYRGMPVYAREAYYMPLGTITGVDWEADSRNPAIVNLTVLNPGGRFPFTFVIDNPSVLSFARVLAGIPGLAETSEAARRLSQA